MKKIKDYLIIILLAANLISYLGIKEAKASSGFQQITLYGHLCITNYTSIWCE